ncbi:MAG: hypothetical protein A2Y40_10080 [Candidatus Margulisbacteria bacterium GWF2_35_9]|nr:MAG: hypothetical protein A2Y40_10080 [Candidatus Margulisbacteria bacterium GWF2_35_9]
MELNLLLAVITLSLVVVIGLPDLLQDPGSYLHGPSALIVMVGSISSLLISSKFKNFKKFLYVLKFIILPPKKTAPIDAIHLIVNLSKISKSKGKQALMPEMEKMKDPFMKFSVQLITEKLDYDFIKTTLYNDISEMENRHDHVANMYKNMSQFTPIFGMIGTIIGLIQVLKNLEDPSKIGPAMALALVTTLYGGVFSGLIFVPFNQKLRTMSEEEAFLKKLQTEGILLIVKDEIPLKVEKYLMSFLEAEAKLKKKK